MKKLLLFIFSLCISASYCEQECKPGTCTVDACKKIKYTERGIEKSKCFDPESKRCVKAYDSCGDPAWTGAETVWKCNDKDNTAQCVVAD